MTRRLFLASSASTLAVAQSPPASRIVVGVVGAGLRGLQLIHACLDQPSVRIGAICETYEPRMFGAGAITRARGHQTRYYRIYRDLIADGDIDAVIVATPDFSHHVITMEALRAGKHVYVEQPLCRTWQEGVELLKAEREASRVIQVGCQRRSSPLYLEATEQIASGVLGPIQLARAWRSSNALRAGVLQRGGVKLPEPLNFPDWQAGAAAKVPFSVDRFLNWRYYPEYGGGPVADLGCQVVDGFHMLAGVSYPVSVKASGIPLAAEGLDTVERAIITAEYAGEQLFTMTLNAAAIDYPEDRRELTTIEADAGRCEITPFKSTGWKMRSTVPAWQRGVLNGPDAATRTHIANFFDAIRQKQTARAPVSAAFAATLICQMANLSIKSGRTARWNAANQQVEI